MDWFGLVNEAVIKEKEDREQEACETVNDSQIEPEGELNDFEIAGLLGVLNSLSLQLSVLDIRSSASNEKCDNTSTKKLLGVVEKTMLQLHETGTFEHLRTTIVQELIKRRGDQQVEKDSKENERKIRELQLQIRSNDKIKMRDLNKKQEIIALLKDEVQNLIARSESKIRYVDRWENAQQGENLLKCENQEMELKWELDMMTARYNNERVVNDKTCSFLSVQTQELIAELEKWKEKYEIEMKNRAEAIGQLQAKVNEQQFRLQELQNLFNYRQKEIRDYLHFKEERGAEEERNRFINESVTKIQAWWRGTMVRRGLGPYKKRKKLARDKKKKDK